MFFTDAVKNIASTYPKLVKGSLPYRISPSISPGLIRVHKAFLLGLSAEELIRYVKTVH